MGWLWHHLHSQSCNFCLISEITHLLTSVSEVQSCVHSCTHTHTHTQFFCHLCSIKVLPRGRAAFIVNLHFHHETSNSSEPIWTLKAQTHEHTCKKGLALLPLWLSFRPTVLPPGCSGIAVVAFRVVQSSLISQACPPMLPSTGDTRTEETKPRDLPRAYSAHTDRRTLADVNSFQGTSGSEMLWCSGASMLPEFPHQPAGQWGEPASMKRGWRSAVCKSDLWRYDPCLNIALSCFSPGLVYLFPVSWILPFLALRWEI